jgi:transposase-like protein
MKSMKKRTFTPEQKAKIVLELLKENKTIAELAAEYEIHPNQLQRWKWQRSELRANRWCLNGIKIPKEYRAVA